VSEIHDWCRRWPDANIGLATGQLSGAVVVDLDGSGARDEAERRGLPAGPTATTGRPGGWHRYCAYRPDAPTVFAKENGIDFRGQGGYVVLPPSRHRSGATYTWLVAPDDAPLDELPCWIDAMANATRTSVAVVGDVILEHQRNVTLLSMGGTMRRRGFGERAIAAALLVENEERCRPPLDEAEVLGIARSLARYAPSASETSPLPTPVRVSLG
jgi:putative DNA primase/helicase